VYLKLSSRTVRLANICVDVDGLRAWPCSSVPPIRRNQMVPAGVNGTDKPLTTAPINDDRGSAVWIMLVLVWAFSARNYKGNCGASA
jgi:hypothetical protein